MQFSGKNSTFLHDDGPGVHHAGKIAVLVDGYFTVANNVPLYRAVDLDAPCADRLGQFRFGFLFHDDFFRLDAALKLALHLHIHGVRAQHLPAHLPFDARGAAKDTLAGRIALAGDDYFSLSLNRPAKGTGDFEIAQIDVRSAFRA